MTVPASEAMPSARKICAGLNETAFRESRERPPDQDRHEGKEVLRSQHPPALAGGASPLNQGIQWIS